ncbi:MAG: hypothetical protein L6R35_001066 [Caloplaca aegaea]|nr:MAG: hypothetical protein L6R35_001066 [Caloplaca aegaea]
MNSHAYLAYLQKIATKWMDEEAGGAEKDSISDSATCSYAIIFSLLTIACLPGRIYTLSALPTGYTLWERPRQSAKHVRTLTSNQKPDGLRKQVDRYLCGHPSHKCFDSPNRFYPHWKFLLNYGSGQACNCDLCASLPSKSRHSSPSSTALSRELGARVLQQRLLQSSPVDEEGTPDVFRSLFTLLKSEGKLKRKIEEKASLDWRAEKPLVDLFASTIPDQLSFLPRYGEMVFYLRPLPPHLQLRYDPSTQIFRIWDNNSSTYASSSFPPKWLAGIVTQVPSILPTELNSADQDGNNLTATGYRIHALPCPSSTQKYLSKQHTYTPLSLIRPFFLHPNTLHCVSPSTYHPSVANALTLSATVSLIDKHTFTGAWPDAAIHSRGIFISGEAYWIGDTAVLLPEQDPSSSAQEIAEIIHITDIVTSFHNLQPSNNTNNNDNNKTGKDDVTGNNCTHITISLHGHVYTSNPTHNSLSRLPVPLEAYTSPMHGYGTWFYIDQAKDIWAAPFSRIMSRLYEKEAMDAWMPSSSPSSKESDRIDISTLGQTSQAIISTRSSHAARTDARILLLLLSRRNNKQKNKWFWGDHRAEALDLATVAGMDVGAYDEERRPGVWRDVLRVLDGRAAGAGAVGVSGVKRRREG